MAKVAVEQPLTDVKKVLEKRGYKAKMVTGPNKIQKFDMYVARTNQDFTDQTSKVPVVGARGRSVNQIVSEVEKRSNLVPGTNKSSKETAKQMGMGALAGGVVGYVAGMLLAPKSGKQMRNDIAEKTQQAKEKTANARDSVKEKTENVKSSVNDKVNKGKEKVNEMKQKSEQKQAESQQQNQTDPAQEEYIVNERVVVEDEDRDIYAIGESTNVVTDEDMK
ncbi:YkuS family protein [Bacillus marinisedimentorum]|uniref:YkuS family protein n=1 Tax=Bacillus marinisedimentorum TaxID=1821260 RepID=UPI00087277A9|nr:YkuS family protein [Bacillus marinisedimentorum]